MAGDMLVEPKFALRVQAIENSVCLFENLVFTGRANRMQIWKDCVHFCVGVVARLLNQFGRQLFDFVHEIFTAELALFHLFELVLPLASHLGAAKCRDPDVVQKINQSQALVGHN